MMRLFLVSLLFIITLAHPLRAAFKVQDVTLQNGLRARLVEDQSLPIVSIVFIIQGGDLYDPLDKPLLSAAIMDLLGEGTETVQGHELKEIFLDKGIQLNFLPAEAFFQTGRRETLMIQLRTTTSALGQALDLLRSIFLKPRFESASLEEWVHRTETSLLNLKKNPSFIGENALRALVYGPSSPWGFSYFDKATFDSLKAITPLDVRSQWSQFLTLDRLKIGVCGHITPHDLKAHMDVLLKDIPPKSLIEPLKAPLFPEEAQEKIITTAHPQAVVQAAHPGVARTHPDYGSFALMTHILAGGMSSRLFTEIREKQGLVYGIEAIPQERQSGALLFFAFESKNDQVMKAFHELKKQLILLKEKGVTKEELARGKTSLLGSQARSYTSTLSTAQHLAISNHFNQPPTFHEDFKKKIDGISLSELNHFITKFLKPHSLQTVIVGQIDPQTESTLSTNDPSATNTESLPPPAPPSPKNQEPMERPE